MPSPSVIAAFAAASLLLLVIPGLAVLYIVNRSVSDGGRAGLAAVAGVQLGTLMHAIGAAAGLSAVLATSAAAFTVVKWLGAGSLVYVGVRTMTRRAPALDASRPAISLRRAFGQGFVVNLFNPKIALFFLSFLPQFIRPDSGAFALQAMVLGLVFCGVGVVSDGPTRRSRAAPGGARERRALPFVQRYVAGRCSSGSGSSRRLRRGPR